MNVELPLASFFAADAVLLDTFVSPPFLMILIKLAAPAETALAPVTLGLLLD